MSLPAFSLDHDFAPAREAPGPVLRVVRRVEEAGEFSPEVAEGICAVVRREGLSDAEAGLVLGVRRTALTRWLAADEEFGFRLEQARALFVQEQVRRVLEARRADGTPDWRASAWLLERMCPEHFGTPAQRRRAAGDTRHAAPPDEVRSALADAGEDREDAPSTEKAIAEIAEIRLGLGGVTSTSWVLSQPREVQLRPQGHYQVQLGNEEKAPALSLGGDGKGVALAPEVAHSTEKTISEIAETRWWLIGAASMSRVLSQPREVQLRPHRRHQVQLGNEEKACALSRDGGRKSVLRRTARASPKLFTKLFPHTWVIHCAHL